MTGAVENDVKPVKSASRALFWWRVVVLPATVSALLVTAIIYVPVAGWTTNNVTTGESAGYPDVKPRLYDSAPVNTLQFAAAAASGIRNFKVVRRDEEAGTLTAEVRTAIPLFTDDLTLTVTRAGADNRSSRVVIRSQARGGFADFGENARHIRALQAAMDERLPQLAGDTR